MSRGSATALQAGFARAGGTDLFCLEHLAGTEPPHGRVLLLPPFAEELNKTRRMVACGARAMAEAGWQVCVADPRGCGDSPGDFAITTLDQWVDDWLALAEDRIAVDGGPMVFWALRGGALWLPRLTARWPAANLLLWQPVLSGRTALTQFLRLKSAASMVAGGAGGGTSALRQALLETDTAIEVAGYALGSGMARSLDAAAWQLPQGFSGRVAWGEVGAPAAATLSPASQTQADRLRQAGVALETATVEGPAFWQTTEVEECPALIDWTVSALAEFAAAVNSTPEAADARS